MTARIAAGVAVHVFGCHDAEPVYHQWVEAGVGRGNWATDCGITDLAAAVTLPAVHARRFARPCRRCYPAGHPEHGEASRAFSETERLELARDGRHRLELARDGRHRLEQLDPVTAAAARLLVDRRIAEVLGNIGCFCTPERPELGRRDYCTKHWLLDRLCPDALAVDVALRLDEVS